MNFDMKGVKEIKILEDIIIFSIIIYIIYMYIIKKIFVNIYMKFL
jgi:hypothetical protein